MRWAANSSSPTFKRTSMNSPSSRNWAHFDKRISGWVPILYPTYPGCHRFLFGREGNQQGEKKGIDHVSENRELAIKAKRPLHASLASMHLCIPAAGLLKIGSAKVIGSRTWTKTKGKVAVFSAPVHSTVWSCGSELNREASLWLKRCFWSNVEFLSPRVVIFVFLFIGLCFIIILSKISKTTIESRTVIWVDYNIGLCCTFSCEPALIIAVYFIIIEFHECSLSLGEPRFRRPICSLECDKFEESWVSRPSRHKWT